MKSTTCLTIDTEILKIARGKYPRELSQMFENFLKNLLKSDIKTNSREDYVNKLKEVEKLSKNYNSQLYVLQDKISNIDKKNNETQQILTDNKKQEVEINNELKKSLTLKEIQFFNNLNEKSNNVFNTNYYNNTFFTSLTEKQYLKRFQKFEEEIMKLNKKMDKEGEK